MRHKALSAWRLPPRSEAVADARARGRPSTGLAPHKAAKEASWRMRSGLSPAAMSNEAAVSGPHAVGAGAALGWLGRTSGAGGCPGR